ncbi:MAG: GAF domain-containing protein [Candidatus Rokubacteria bacterium]|nr:GAF domain-containing protein [Candidatus Rokubacteria bacterium]
MLSLTPGRERALVWLLLGVVLFSAVVTTSDAWRSVGNVGPGFTVMENLQVPPGGADRAMLQPFDLIVAVNGQLIRSAQQLVAEVRRHPPGTVLHYTVARAHQALEFDIATVRIKTATFKRYLLEGLLPGLVFLALGVLVIWVKPGAGESRVFLAFCVCNAVTSLGYGDFIYTHRFTRPFLVFWSLTPAALLHLALTFPARRSIARQYPWIVAVPWIVAIGTAVSLQTTFFTRASMVPAIISVYLGLALGAVMVSLARTSRAGTTPLMRQRARVLSAGFAVGYALPVLGTAAETVFRTSLPYLDMLWRLNLLFPVAVAYAIVRYNLFDVRAVLRTGAVYSAATAVVVLAYAGALTLLNVSFALLDMSVSPIVPAAAVSLAVVLFLNPVYVRTQGLVDRAFFRQRYDAQRALERLADAMTSVLELPRIVSLITRTVDEVFHPADTALLLSDEGRKGYRALPGAPRAAWIAEDSPLPRCFQEHRLPLTRERLHEDPRLGDLREPCAAAMDGLRADVVVPIVFRDRLAALLVLGPKRSRAPYTTEDLRLLRGLVNQRSSRSARSTSPCCSSTSPATRGSASGWTPRG